MTQDSDRRWVTSNSECQKCLKLLQSADGPLVAADIAARLHLSGSRETQRRRVRGIVQQLRDDGNWIVACGNSGYWLTQDARVWKDYQEGRKIDAKRIIGESHRKQMEVDQCGQGLLFGAKALQPLGYN